MATETFNLAELIEQAPASAIFSKLDNERSSILTRARDCSALTIPSVLPADGHTEETTLDTPYQGVGARLVNGLSSKLLLSLLPPNTSFFRLTIDQEIKEKAKTSEQGAKALEEDELRLVMLEQEATRQIEKESLRVPSFELFKSLIITGNALGYKMEKGLKSYKLDQYVIQRDYEGNVIDIVTKEMVGKDALPKAVANAVEFESEETTDVTIYTRVVRKADTWYEWQEVEDVLIPGSEANYKLEETPYIPLRWTSVNGENYGRGLVEQYLGDFRNLEGLYQLVIETAAVQARTIFGKVPGGLTDMEEFQDAVNGQVIYGNLEEDIVTSRVDKGADLQVPMELVQILTRRLEQAFLSASSAVRDSERTTLGEIRYLANDLEESLGGVHSILAQEFQNPLAKILLKNMDTSVNMEGLDLIIVTGVEALGRNNDIDKLRQLNSLIQELGSPELVLQRMNIDNYITDISKNLGLPQDRYIKGEQQLAQEQQQAQGQALEQQGASNLVDKVTQ